MNNVIGCGMICFIIVFVTVFYHLFCWNNVSFLSWVNNRVWVSSFECGFMGVSLVENVFSSKYLLMLVFFVLFDLEVSLLLNAPYHNEFYSNLGYYGLFIMFVSVGYCFESYLGYIGWDR